jgi:hypothetical protein
MLACCNPATASAAAINAGMHVLAPNMAGQQVQIHVTGGEAVSGIDFFVQVGDGGATVGGTDTGPKITSVDLVTGTIFGANNTGVFTDPAPLLWGATTTTSSGTVLANGLLATLTVDTSGFTSGQFNLILNPPSTGPTAFADAGVTTSLTNGWLNIVAPLPLAGDYNNNGGVDAADFVVWRDNDGTSVTLPNDNGIGGTIGQPHYNLWRAQFGQTTGSGSANGAIGPVNAAVPEAASFVVLGLAAVGLLRFRLRLVSLHTVP